MAKLENLDNINWAGMNHAYGPATDVPDQLRAMASGNAKTQRKAIKSCYSNIYHQGTVYEATAYAVPFIVEILETTPDEKLKPEILDLLYHLSHGYSYIDVHQHIDWAYNQETRESDEFKAELQRELSWVKAAYEAVADYYEVYLRFLESDDDKTKMMAVVLLSGLHTKSDEVLPRLLVVLEAESNPEIQSVILSALPALAQDRQEQIGAAIIPYLTADSSLARLFSAASMIRLRGNDAPPVVLEILGDAFANAEVKDGYNDLYWVDGSLAGYIGMTLCFARLPFVEPIVPKLIEALSYSDWYENTSIIYALLYLVLDKAPLPAGTTGKDLTPLQRDVIAAIAKDGLQGKGAKGETIRNGDVFILLTDYGLPNSVEGLNALLDA